MKISHKAKQFFYFSIKLIVVGWAFYLINNQLKEKPFDINPFINSSHQIDFWLKIILLLFLTFLNRFIEILKWQNLTEVLKPISITQSTKEVLIAITFGVFTPNGLGEYAGKTLFYPKSKILDVLFLNAVNNGLQVAMAVSFGLFGVFYIDLLHAFLPRHTWEIFTGILLILILLVFNFRNLQVKKISLKTLCLKWKMIPVKKHQKNAFLAFCRYLVLIHQYFLLYSILGASIHYFDLMATIAAVYLLASSLPNFQAIDFALKGSVAIYLLGFFGINPWIVSLVATSIWLLNFVVPISIGSILLLIYKPLKKL